LNCSTHMFFEFKKLLCFDQLCCLLRIIDIILLITGINSTKTRHILSFLLKLFREKSFITVSY
jgi:hypothetical protein